MFNDCGEKIKNVAKILCWVGVIANVIWAIVMFVKAGDSWRLEGLFIGLGFVFLIVGPIISVIEGMLIYGFGELIDSNIDIKRRMSFIDVKKETPKPEELPEI